MMEALTRRVFEQALHWFSRLPSSTRIIGNGVADISELSLGINVSARAFTRLTFADELLALVGQHGLSPDQVVLELDRKSTRLNSSHVAISYAVFCLKKKTT